jgi:hypothetical protein
MELPILVEKVAGNGFRASGAAPWALSAEGPTREAALAELKLQLDLRVKNGAEIVALQLDLQPHPWMAFAGMFKDDPLFDDWQKSIADYRREVDADPDYP